MDWFWNFNWLDLSDYYHRPNHPKKLWYNNRKCKGKSGTVKHKCSKFIWHKGCFGGGI